MIEAKGHTGSVTFDGAFVVITKKALMNKGEKRIPLQHVTGVQIKPPTLVQNGVIQFSLAGATDVQGRINAVQDENAVLFTKKQQPDFERLAAAVQQAIAGHFAPQPQPQAAAPDVMQRMQQLTAMRDQGFISQQEFDAKRAEILGGL